MRFTGRLNEQDAGTLVSSADTIEVRPLVSHEDFAACVQLQREIWGEDYNEVVPAVILKIGQKVGGVAAGAFDEEGNLQGCVFGLTGVEQGRIVHWSHMLAVCPDFRNSGIGRRLKEYQRDLLLPMGVEVVYWTFDPLFARNAHLNLTRLGAEVVEYVTDMYGRTGSGLHALGTDRFVVAWPLRSDDDELGGVHPEASLADPAALLQLPVVNRDSSGEPAPSDQPLPTDPEIRIEIPTDIEAVQATSLPLAKRWQKSVQRAFIWYLEQGYRVTGFQRELEDGRCHYILRASNSSEVSL
jgi:predicted GNAT superfamily acetyltransferase